MLLMRFRTKAAAVILLCAGAFLQGPRAIANAVKPPEVEVLEMTLQRNEGRIEVDTTVKNLSPKAINGFTAVYHFFAFGHQPITTQRTKLDEPVFAPGAESTIRAQLGEPARAVSVEFAAVDEHGHEYRVKNAGPFNID